MTLPPFRLELDDQLLPVQAFFNALPESEFLRYLGHLAEGEDFGYNGIGYALPSDDADSPKDGILFYLPFEDVTVSNAEMLKYLRLALDAHVGLHPEERSAADDLYSRVANRYAD